MAARMTFTMPITLEAVGGSGAGRARRLPDRKSSNIAAGVPQISVPTRRTPSVDGFENDRGDDGFPDAGEPHALAAAHCHRAITGPSANVLLMKTSTD